MHMNPLLHQLEDTTSPLHHFYLIDGNDTVSIAKEIKSLLLKRDSGFVSLQFFSQFDVEDALSFRSLLATKAVGPRFLIFAVDSFTAGALQSLLKLLEEPGANTHIFFVVPNMHVLPETIRSRAYLITVKHSEDSRHTDEALVFANASFAERIVLVDTLLKKANSSGEEREFVRKFLDDLESLLCNQNKTGKHANALFRILNYKKYLLLPGAHVRMILESLAVTID